MGGKCLSHPPPHPRPGEPQNSSTSHFSGCPPAGDTEKGREGLAYVAFTSEVAFGILSRTEISPPVKAGAGGGHC